MNSEHGYTDELLSVTLKSPPRPRAVSFSGKPGFCRGSAPVPTLPIHDLQAFQGLGFFTREEPLQRMKQPCPPAPQGGKSEVRVKIVCFLLLNDFGVRLNS